MDFNLNLPINSLSFGQVSINILKELHKRNLQPSFFGIGNSDFSAFKLSDDFNFWFKSCESKFLKSHSRRNPTIKLWHLNQDSLFSPSDKQILLTFHETDFLTEEEINICKNNSKVLFSSSYSSNIAKTFGAENVSSFPLGFDADSFKILSDKKKNNNIIQFGLAGKLEPVRKQHLKVINLWVKKFGNNPDYALNIALYNPFIRPEIQQNFLNQAVEGKHYWNVNSVPYMQGNDAYNDFLNKNDIILDMSAAEGWSLPSFQSVCLGKHALVLNSTGIKEWATPENAILVQPNGKIPLYDGMFFHQGGPFNQGSGFSFSDESFYDGLDKVLARFKDNAVNTKGLELKDKFTYSGTVDTILKELESI